ncbi:MAG: type 4a pilus biogenesis protein PilO [Gemmatimonadaceae bacterium]
MAILPATKRDRIFAGIGFAAIALVVAYYMYVWDPKKEELNTSQLRLDSLQVINQRAKAELAQGKTNELKLEAERLTQDLAVMRLLVPTSNEVPALLDQVSTAARRAGLDIADVQPLPSLAGDQYEAYKYRLAVRGAYHQIASLLTNIGTLQRIVAPINLTLTPAANDPRAAKRDRVQNLEARFEIQTYVARAPLPAPPVKGTPTTGIEKPKPGEK